MDNFQQKLARLTTLQEANLVSPVQYQQRYDAMLNEFISGSAAPGPSFKAGRGRGGMRGRGRGHSAVRFQPYARGGKKAFQKRAQVKRIQGPHTIAPEVYPASDGLGLFNVPVEVTADELKAIFEPLGAILMRMSTNKRGALGFAFVYFSTVEQAAAARASLEGSLTLGSQQQIIEFRNATKTHSTVEAEKAAKPLAITGGKGVKTPKGAPLAITAGPSDGLGLFNVPTSTTEAELKVIFEPLGAVLMRMSTSKGALGYAFVYFSSVEEAKAARASLEGTLKLGDQLIEFRDATKSRAVVAAAQKAAPLAITAGPKRAVKRERDVYI